MKMSSEDKGQVVKYKENTYSETLLARDVHFTGHRVNLHILSLVDVISTILLY